MITDEMIEAFKSEMWPDGYAEGGIARALTAALAAQPKQGVKVKPLEWCNGHPGTYMLVAESVLGLYMAWEINGTGAWSLGSLPGKFTDGGIEAAKSTAQSDYEARILSVLEDAG